MDTRNPSTSQSTCFSSKGLPKEGRKKEVIGQERNRCTVDIIVVRKSKVYILLADFARYRCTVGDRFGEIQESMLKLNVVR